MIRNMNELVEAIAKLDLGEVVLNGETFTSAKEMRKRYEELPVAGKATITIPEFVKPLSEKEQIIVKTVEKLRERIGETHRTEVQLVNGIKTVVEWIEDDRYTLWYDVTGDYLTDYSCTNTSLTEIAKKMIMLGKDEELPRAKVSNCRRPTENFEVGSVYKIAVRQYMTKPASREFDFHDKFNNGTPMPLRIMAGRVMEQTRGMVKMECWGQMFDEIETICFKCGRKLTHPVSKYFGLGPECGSHAYKNPLQTDEELREAVETNNQYLRSIKWTGWIIKSAITEKEIIE